MVSIDINDIFESGEFIEVTKEEYVKVYAKNNNITVEEVTILIRIEVKK